MTAGRRFIPEVDGLRFVAISAVLLFHLNTAVWDYGVPPGTPRDGPLASLVAQGFYGVELFFVLSGFILGLPFARVAAGRSEPVNLKAYYLRRLTRLEPPYVLALVGVFLAGLLIGRRRGLELWPSLLAGLVYQHNAIFGEANVINGVAWSLEVEVQFYVLMPLLARLFFIRHQVARRGLLLGLIGASAAVGVFFVAGHPRLELSLAGHLHEFLAGLLLADVYVSDWKEAPATAPRWDLVALVGWALLPWLVKLGGWVGLALPFLVLVLYMAAFRGPIMRRVLSSPWLVTIGGMCYSIYLLHHPILMLLSARLAPLVPRGSFESRLFVYAGLLVPTLLVCAAFFVLVERPCMNPAWPRELASRWRGTAVSRAEETP